ncbi:chromosome segregation protein SMC [Sporosarcina sp. HYO08]|uniref:chromosome segregation protein SMC n=1 Tax=Sporosarcina sp. HYO08 TaxID=1759557 RepID=UPI000794C50E|nr:chromosome segregation protein SMC [Sporosarcina sp. HYO08]KXH79954.1 hypothetical protein AU377_10790 [Sporosarcina sp. HYO08]
MFLKRLEIIGFKSFAERIGIDFVPGVTAVVGPNGSGKSNITDAIRWVLGEQSVKSLRGSKMEDVIFAGSDSRKPLNFAEVTLILDNSKGLFPLDYTEISVSRRVFRSGESTFLLNGQQCRLKDINDVFMDSGLGKEAFSIISQGRVDEILNSRAEDRRSIFDEAAGVLKYKTRKRKAEHKLFETVDNLDRVQDILKELDVRMVPLQKHAEAAKRHHVLSDELREADVLLLNHDARALQDELKGKIAKIETLKREKGQFDGFISQIEGEAARITNELTSIDEQLESLQRKLIDASAESEKWEGRRLLSLEKRRNADKQLERLRVEKNALEEEQARLTSNLEAARREKAVTKDEYEKLNKELENVSQILKRSATETEKEIEDLKSLYIERLNEEATLRNEIKHMEERLENEKTSSAKIAQQMGLLTARLEELQAEKAEKMKVLADLQRNMKDAEKSYHSAGQALREQEEALASQQTLMQQALNKQHEMNGRLRALESMEKDYSGFFLGVKEVLVANQSGKLTGIDGAVAELISVENQYVKAVETALGGAMQNIVTETDHDARKAIGYLKMKNAGRATFLPRNIMKSRKIQASVLQSVERHPDFIGTADQLVQTEKTYVIIAENLLGHTIVAKTLEGASAIAKTLNYRYRIVTIDGDVVNAGGSLTGGGVKGQASVFTRKAELEHLKTQVSRMAASIEAGTQKIGESKLLVAGAMQTAEQARSLVENLQMKKTSAQSSIRETEIAIGSVQSEITSIELGRRGTENAGAELLAKMQQLKSSHAAVKQELGDVQSKVNTLERLLLDWRNEEAILTSRYNELRERLAVLREQRGHQKSSIDQIVQAMERTNNKLLALKDEMQFLTGHEEVSELSTEEITAKIEQAIIEKKEFEQALHTKRARREDLKKTLDEQNIKLRHFRGKAETVLHVLNTITVATSRLEVKYEAVTEQLLSDYGLFPDAELVTPGNDQVLRENVQKLREELEALGPINPGSIVEYEEVYSRHAFLTAQRNDLLEAKSTLEDAMFEMDEEMKIRFSTTFNAAQKRFRQVFKEMFGGGEADLILTHPDQLLETGVEIVARPPGKKLQKLSLLSGGERALTAISLLFSIIGIRPVPFCILDEVEAALDEANVIRYSKYLKKFSEKTQFIVITHRKGTMEGADVLYGVTMQESGVSKLISVKLSEVTEEAIT